MSRERITAMMSDPGLVRSIRSTLLLRGVPEREVPDMVQEAFAAAFACERLPESEADAKNYLFGIVRNQAAMLLRSWHDRNHAAFAEELQGETEPAPFEERDLVRKLVARVPENRWQTFQWFVRVTFGDALADIAREEGVDYAVAHARLTRLRDDLRQWAVQLTKAAAIVALVIGGYRLLRPRHEAAIAPDIAPEPPRVVMPAPPPVAPAASTLLEEAAALRRRALDECRDGLLFYCQRDLDEAAARDPASESDPAVKAARDRLKRARDFVWSEDPKRPPR
jgi:DNA-directed RNA polymerase specialized sigma24 family protein